MKQLSSMIVGLACSGSSTPPMPTPPERCTFLPICAHEPDGRPRVDHRALVDVGADVHEGRHQHDVRRDVGAAARDGRRHDPDAGGGELVVGQAGELGRHLVVERERLGAAGAALETHGAGFGQAEREQHRLLDPLVRRPGAVDLLGDAQAPGIETGDHLPDGVARRRRARFAGRASSAFPTRCRSRARGRSWRRGRAKAADFTSTAPFPATRRRRRRPARGDKAAPAAPAACTSAAGRARRTT